MEKSTEVTDLPSISSFWTVPHHEIVDKCMEKTTKETHLP
jgi:hypothetical protein